MTTLTAPSTELTTAILDSAAVAAELLPSGPWTAERIDDPTLPDDSRAVAMQVDGLGRVVLVASAELVSACTEDGSDLVAALSPALTQAVASMSDESQANLAAATVREIGVASALAVGVGESVLAVAMTGDGVTAVLVVIVDPSSAKAGFANHILNALSDGMANNSVANPVSMLGNVEMGVSVELGRARMLVKEILALSIGSVIELDRAAGSPVDVLVNGTLIARGEVVVVDEEFGVRISEVIGHNADTHWGRR